MRDHVAKFGGTSLATPEAFEQAYQIVASNSDLKAVVVSAPGKIPGGEKVTDLLIKAGNTKLAGQEPNLDEILGRYKAIADSVGITDIMSEIEHDLRKRLDFPKCEIFLSNFIAAGEDNCAKLFSQYCYAKGLKDIKSRYIDPVMAGFKLTHIGNGIGRVHPDAYAKLAELKISKSLIIFPGFFGEWEYSVITLARGGSDVSGAVLANALDASMYWNFTDIDGVRAAHPKIVPDSRVIEQITYEEMRELSVAGFEVLHEDAVGPLYKKGIPVRIKCTTDPSAPGTLITPSRRHDSRSAVIGIACRQGYSSIGVQKLLMNHEEGFGNKLLGVLADHHISYDHDMDATDYISVIMRSQELKGKEESVINSLYTDLKVNEASILDRGNLSMVLVVGQGLPYTRHAASRATAALAQADIDVLALSYPRNSKSIAIGVDDSEAELAVRALYNEFI